MAVNELLGELDSLKLIVAPQINAILDMTVWPHDERTVPLHLLAPNRD
ncbi:hypothetical protein [Bradyrhizobium sp. BWA-3-5]|nr:hypothetical protein [Bradyrhizobium sp. BWA-3-5]WOH69606.1 hypothetical protein RX331_18720 [Bradyrhizobium sp. BWA-3-5]